MVCIYSATHRVCKDVLSLTFNLSLLLLTNNQDRHKFYRAVVSNPEPRLINASAMIPGVLNQLERFYVSGVWSE